MATAEQQLVELKRRLADVAKRLNIWRDGRGRSVIG